ncbi:TELO2-interacting protein 2 [Phoca vitulina]|uniref:TELO2-interacting protein 2 n=1 Tax=Phoca vitulina TaxID=9720 RepID=UPI001395F8BD|nr:TELO2-interacting protein 2 [Phoca vitulina]XP_032269325.1 TELO2-interacting protein 2 [Phoca vitulina]XP_032269326.1 TELO2-interacting protein 2 [Phoca vitulina]XP_032269327.1 TELO2-interacting protein 2 [Phoca vitulina]XP_032269328.1 TELO2-interacting protein 2 [Phoca vitulina]XP_032269329.1 TELO2-interacting protein 2 [Phoca vitulina]XP_032269330.1 TELO2-interacting protein 2 [Phoca vitulina]XP_032269331.1 TELO2-interacting protein 2 [Phoca vitulina]
MEQDSPRESPSQEGASLPGERPSSALGQSFSQVLHRLTSQESGRGKARSAVVQDLGALIEATDCDQLFEGGGTSPRGMPEMLGQVAEALEKYAAPPKEQQGRGHGRSEVAEKAAAVGVLFLKLLGKIEAAQNSLLCPTWKIGLRHLAGPIYIFAVTHSLEQPWTSPRSHDVAGEVLSLLLRVTRCGSVAGFLHGENEDEKGRFTVIMELLKPDLNKESWKKNPATKHVFSWTLQQVTRPWLNEHLERVLPPSLLISDDYQTENKTLGVHCLHHIVLNVPAADLLQYNRAQVLYHALFNHLYTPEYNLIQAVLLCLLDLFPVLEKGLHWKGGAARPTTHCDEVLQLILTHMEPEHRLLLRRTYARNLPAFVKRLGILTVRHLKRLERVIIGYLEVYDGPEEEARLKILETLKLLMQYAWPRVSCRLVVLLKALLKLICDVAKDPNLTPEPVKNTLLEEATDCLILLDHCSQGQVKGLLVKILQSCEDSKVVNCIRKVQQVSEGASCDGT